MYDCLLITVILLVRERFAAVVEKSLAVIYLTPPLWQRYAPVTSRLATIVHDDCGHVVVGRRRVSAGVNVAKVVTC